VAHALPPLALAYHGIAEVPLRSDPHGLFVAPDDFRQQLERLRAWGYEFVRFGELAERVGLGRGQGCAALTFDDGLVDNLETLAPLLREASAPATVFVVSGWLGGEYPWATWTRILSAGEVRALAGEGVEIGSHTTSHPDLSTLGYEESLAELAGSKQELEDIVGAPVETLAYPFGRTGEAAIAACRAAGYRAACRASGAGSWDTPHALPRQDMDNRCSLLGLRLKRDDRYEPLMRFRPARAARRLARRVRSAAG
jgi:peptidoglycan/xylan/chitin deacetylase (PgdA/CDA1 family)